MNKVCNVDVDVLIWSIFRTLEIKMNLHIVGRSYQVHDLGTIHSIRQQLAGYMQLLMKFA